MSKKNIIKVSLTAVFCLCCLVAIALITYICTITWIRMTESKRARFYFGDYAYHHGLEDRVEDLWKHTAYALMWKFVYDWKSFEYNAKLLETIAKADSEGLKNCKDLQTSQYELDDVMDEQQFCVVYLNSTVMKRVVEEGVRVCEDHSKNVKEEVVFLGNGKNEPITREIECVPYVLGRVTSFTHADRITQCAENNRPLWDCAKQYCQRWFSADK